MLGQSSAHRQMRGEDGNWAQGASGHGFRRERVVNQSSNWISQVKADFVGDLSPLCDRVINGLRDSKTVKQCESRASVLELGE